MITEEPMNAADLKDQAMAELRRQIVLAMKVGMTAQEVIGVLKSAIGVLESGDMK